MKQNGFTAKIIKTNIIDVDDGAHALPPHGGNFSEYKVADWNCPDEWSNDGVFIPVKEGDPMWFDFTDNDECAVLVAVQRLNPVTGEPADLEGGLTKEVAQNYLSMPRQKWLDGYVNDGKVYQFIVTKAGIGLAVNEFVLPKHMQDSHALGFAFFAPKNPKPKVEYRPRSYDFGGWDMGCFKKPLMRFDSCGGGGTTTMGFNGGLRGLNSSADATYDSLVADDYMHNDSLQDDGTHETSGMLYCDDNRDDDLICGSAASELDAVETVDILNEDRNLTELAKASMGQGGRITQRIVQDENTVDYYHKERSALLTVYLALPEMFDAIMQKGKRQDSTRKDKFTHSGKVGSVQVPLISQENS